MQSRFPELSISQLAKALKIDRRTVSKRVEHLGDEATIEEIIAALVTSEGIEEARRRKVMADAQRVELRLKQEQGELVRKLEVSKTLTEFFKGLYRECTITAPQRIAERCEGKPAAEIREIIREEYAGIFTKLRGDWTAFSGSNGQGHS